MKASKALISVSDKEGVVDFAKALSDLGVVILSTGGTSKALSDAGVDVTEVSDYTGFPEMLDGRVKTLHPKVEAGILAVRDSQEHMRSLKEHEIEPIDIVCVNLYPFRKTIESPGCTFEDAIENIDIGGPTLVRAAAKNHADVAVVTDPADYQRVVEDLRSNGGEISGDLKRSLALKAFQHTAEYDAFISKYLADEVSPGVYPDRMSICLSKAYDLRYGENPHQSACYYYDEMSPVSVKDTKIVCGGKQLSFNNLIDVNAALEMAKEFSEPTAVIVKHLNPSGVGSGKDILSAYEAAHSADPLSAYGCIVALNRPPCVETAKQIVSTFVEVVAAPSFSDEVVDILKTKEKMRVLGVGDLTLETKNLLDYRRVVGGMLIQQADVKTIGEEDLKVVSERQPSAEEVKAMLFAWKVCKHTKSNTIVFAKADHTVGVGAGQMSRVDAVKIASMKAGKLAEGAVMASDAFFPFRDGVDEAAKAGVTAVIHPGGSIRDAEVVEAVNEHGMAMVYTGTRCFLH